MCPFTSAVIFFFHIELILGHHSYSLCLIFFLEGFLFFFIFRKWKKVTEQRLQNFQRSETSWEEEEEEKGGGSLFFSSFLNKTFSWLEYSSLLHKRERAKERKSSIWSHCLKNNQEYKLSLQEFSYELWMNKSLNTK